MSEDEPQIVVIIGRLYSYVIAMGKFNKYELLSHYGGWESNSLVLALGEVTISGFQNWGNAERDLAPFIK